MPVPTPGVDTRRIRGASGRVGAAAVASAAQPEDCPVFLRDNHPAYLTWEQYQTNLRRLEQHRRRGPVPGPARATVAVLAGLVVCGECGCRMQTHYTRTLRYVCQRRALDYAAPPCQSLAGAALEQLVRDQVLEVVTPAGLELSRRAAQECQRERAALDRQWRLRLERAAQDADRAFRQYNAVEPENRLVARTLERALGRGPAGAAELGGGIPSVPAGAARAVEPGGARRDRGPGPRPAGVVASAHDLGGGEASSRAVAVAARGGLGTVVEPGSESAIALDRRHGDGASDQPSGADVGASRRRGDGVAARAELARRGLDLPAGWPTS